MDVICVRTPHSGSGAQPRLRSRRGPRFGYEHRGAGAPRSAKGRAGCWCGRGSPPPAVRVRGYHPRKIFENSDAKFCILVTTCCVISRFLIHEVRDDQFGEPVSTGPYGCCAYAPDTDSGSEPASPWRRSAPCECSLFLIFKGSPHSL